jgi:hypothetical protein
MEYRPFCYKASYNPRRTGKEYAVLLVVLKREEASLILEQRQTR